LDRGRTTFDTQRTQQTQEALRTGWVDRSINPMYTLAMEFGKILRELRTKEGIGIKRLAPRLGVNYSYLSKLENNDIGPSEQLIDRVAAYFDYDRNRLLLSAGKVPGEVLSILRDNPDEAIEFLRERFGRKRERSAT